MVENPYESSNVASGATGPRMWFPSLLQVILCVAVGGILVALLIPARRGSREAARRNACTNNLRQIAIALNNYESALGSPPPAYTVDAEGNRLHSWRTLLLPYMEEEHLYERIDLTRPWDDPVNEEARDAFVHAYSCPSATHEDGLTTYLAIVGADGRISGATPRAMPDIDGDLEGRLIVIDVASDMAVPWMSPNDLDEDFLPSDLFDSNINHVGVIKVLDSEGRVGSVVLE